ncbi:hypothetical protein, partial [Pseudomonas sp. PA15(2017)]|uniref:hypothetical protein n=1 Tax=Pseudomonas sp. PA15(2017) TaxID=1932111 RepID=UPI000AB68C67
QTGQDSTEGLNRDVSNAYEITRDDEERTDLYVTKSSVEAVAAVAQAAAEKVAREVQAQRVNVEEIPPSARASLGDERALAMAKNLARNGLDPELMKGLSPKTLENLVSWADSAENYNKVYDADVGANTSAESAAQTSAGGTLNLAKTKVNDASRSGGEAFLREIADFREYLGTLPVAEAQIALLGMQVFMGPAKAAVSLAGNVLINAMFGDKIDAIKDSAAVGMTASLRDEDKKAVQEEHDYAKQQYAAGEDGYLDGDGGVLASRFLIDLAVGEIGSLTKKVAGKAVGVVSGGQQGSGSGAKGNATTGNVVANEATNANAQAALRAKLSGLQKAQETAAITKTLPDGRVRYYTQEVPARTEGTTRGASFVTELDPKTGNTRQWMESYDHSGSVIRVHPKSINGQPVDAQHYPPTGAELKSWGQQ